MRLASIALVLATACGHAPPPKPAAAEKPVQSVADVAGHWVTSDDMDWSYKLALDASGTIDMMIDRNKMGRCEQKGTIAAGEAPKTFQITYAKNECNRDYNGAVLQMQVASFTGETLTLVISGWGNQEKHVFTRAPAQ